MTECCIKGCWPLDRTASKEKKSLFKVPENGTIEWEKWQKNIGQYIEARFQNRKSLHVCEDHFEKECLFQNAIPIFVNGKRETVPRKRVRLMPESLPTKFPNCPSNAASPNTSAEDASESLLPPKRQPHTSLSNLLNCTLKSTATPTIPSSMKKPMSSSATTDPSLISDTSPYSHIEELISARPGNESCPQNLSADNTSDNTAILDDENAYNIEKLMDDWNNCASPFYMSWGCIRVPGIGIQFVCYAHLEPLAWLGVLVRNDMTLQAIAGDGVVNYKTKISQITCLDDLFTVTREVSALQICEGAFGERCPIGLYIRKANRKCNRCFDCQKKYRHKSENLRQQRVRSEKKMLSQKLAKKKLKQRVSRSNDKVAKLKRGEGNTTQYGVYLSHDYDVSPINAEALTYFAGFVARKCFRWTDCEACLSSCTRPKSDNLEDEMINNFSDDYLKYPSADLVALLTTLERGILQAVGVRELEFYTFQNVLVNVLPETLKFVGCDTHRESLTEKIIKYYVVARAKIICKNHNHIYSETRKKEQEHRKMAKLVSSKKKKVSNIEEEDDENNSLRNCVQIPVKNETKQCRRKPNTQ